MTRRLLAVVIFALAAIAPAFGQDKMPTAEQVIDKYIQAIGGKAAYQKLNSRMEKGTFEIPAMGASGVFESYSKAPNKNIIVVSIEGFGEIKQGFTGTEGWSVNPMSGMKVLAGDELEDTKREADFYNPIKIKENYPKLELKGTEKVDGKDAYVIVATPAKGTLEKLYFDTRSGLMVRRDSTRNTEQGLIHVEATLSDYKDVDGVKMPFTIKQSAEQGTFVIKLTEIKHNIPVEDAKFNKPSS